MKIFPGGKELCLIQSNFFMNYALSNRFFLQIQRYGTLSQLYSQIGFKRKSSFYKRVSAMQCVAPQNPKQNWHQCYYLLIQALEGYKITLDPKEMRAHGGRQITFLADLFLLFCSVL